MKLLRKKNISPILIALFLLNILTRTFGIWFNRMAWDEQQFYFGGKGILRWLYNTFTGNGFSDISEDLVSIYGISGKYLASIGLAFHELWLSLFGFGSAYDAFVFTRIFSSLIPSLISVYLLYKLAQKLSDSKTFHFAVLFLSAFAFRWVESAHYAVPDSLTALAAIWTILEWVNLQKKQSVWVIFRLAFAISLGLASKINVGLLLWGLVSILFIIELLRKKQNFKNFLILQMLFIGITLLVHLPYLFYLELYIEEIRFHIFDFPFVISGHPLIYFIFKPALGLDWAILIVSVLSIVFLFFRKSSERWKYLPLLVWIVLFFTYLSFSKGAIARWEIPIIPFLLIFASYGIVPIIQLLKKGKIQVITVAVLLILLCARPAYHIFQLDIGLIYQETVWQNLNDDLDKYQCNEKRFNDFDIKIHSVDEFIAAGYSCALIHDHWYNDLDMNDIPAKYENSENSVSFVGSGTQEIRNYIRGNWHKVGSYQPKFYTTWTYNPALIYPVDLYLCDDCIEN
ncbi:MAG: hypothetical protein JXR53_02110 [Bacteroidales bacterium]|nr:hypothetical protein [Bacteroidales bacterium]